MSEKLFKGKKETNVKTTTNNKWFKVSKRVALKINTDVVDEDFIPKQIIFKEDKKTIEQVGIAVSYNMPVLLVGETGTGKTSLIRHLAHETNNAFVRVNHNGGTTIEDLLGRWIINDTGSTVWVDGLLVEAMKKGYWFLADEINAASADVNFVYHSLLDDDARVVLAEKGKEVVTPHANFRFFAGMNPPAEYAGTKELNKALMSRFMVVNVDFPAPKVEEEILMERTGITQDVAEKMVMFANKIRASHSKDSGVNFVLSTRDMIMWGLMFNIYKKYIISAEMSILNKVSPDDFDTIKDMMNLTFKALDATLVTKP